MASGSHGSHILLLFMGLILRFTEVQSELVHTGNGPVEGGKFLSEWTNETIYYFKGIPYASPPVGELRFKDPKPPDVWTQVKDCKREQAVCPQVPLPGSEPLQMSDDCLYLNVYTPQLNTSGLTPLPVIVWIHGGAFLEGSGNYDENGPDKLVAEGVVVVTINYRIGALGFLSMGVPDAPGNVGLKDQRLALVWVSQEIQNFGGDPLRVTLLGLSAGAISAHFHYLSPLSAGLFHRAIGNSGSALAYRVRKDGRKYALELAKRLGCDSEETAKVLACLRAANHHDIIKAQDLIRAQDDVTGITVFVPTIDKDSGVEPFLPDYPYNLMKQKKTFFVPFLMGVTSEEGILRLFRSDEEIRNITNNLEYLHPLQIPEEVCSPKLKVEKIKDLYFKNVSHVKGYVDLYSDVLYVYSTLISTRNYQCSAPVYLYYFIFKGNFNDRFVEEVLRKYNTTGVCHGDDVNYLFVKKNTGQTVGDNSNNSTTTWRRMVRLWTNFAKHGSPTVEPDPLLQNVQWLPASGGRTNHLEIGSDLRMISVDLLAPRAQIWDSIIFNNCS